MGHMNWFLMKRAEYIQVPISELVSVDAHDSQTLSCYPNPTIGDIHLSFDADAHGSMEIDIYDMMGRKVFVQHCTVIQGHNDIVLQPDLKAGVYVLKVGRYTQRIVRF